MDILLELMNNSSDDPCFLHILYIINSPLPLDYYILLIDHTFSIKWRFIGKRTYRNGQLHSFDDQPAVIQSNGTQEWYQHGERHRDNDQPAIIWTNSYKAWYKHGKCHRDNDLPAKIYHNGKKRILQK